MKNILAVNASPRSAWNTAQLVREAAKGAESVGAQAEVVDLYQLEKFTGCVSCFGCKREGNYGKCVCRDGLSDTLEKIREADGLILGSPIYIGNLTAGFLSLYERLIFQYITYCKEPSGCNPRKIPVLLVVTSNCDEGHYDVTGYNQLLENYRRSLERWIGPTQILISSDTLQVKDYSQFHWTMFDPAKKQQRHEEVFPVDLKKAFDLGAALLG